MHPLIRKAFAVFSNKIRDDYPPADTTRVSGAITIGAYSYGLTEQSFYSVDLSVPITIGKFCSFAEEVTIFGRIDHPIDRISTYPFRSLLFSPGVNHDATTRGPVEIGNDVWVGFRSLILSGVRIGDGAVIGARSIVTGDIPAYAVAIGSPAKVVKYRFDPETIAALVEIKWWDWPIEKIRAFEPEFYGPIEGFIARALAAKA